MTENNLYKNFFIGYNYLSRCFHILWNQLIINIVMLGMRWGFYILNQPWFQDLQRIMNQYRHRKEDIRSEPIENIEPWISISQTIPKTERHISNIYFWKKTDTKRNNQFILNEKYFNPIDTYNVDKVSKTNDLFHSLYIHNFILKDKKIKQVSVNATTFNKYLVKNYIIVPSKVNFLDIQYSHPNMTNPLVLELPKEYFFAGNELFSPAFVQRMLYYQPYPFVFDMNYTLEIMDKDLNSVILKPNQYIRLCESDYEIIEIFENGHEKKCESE